MINQLITSLKRSSILKTTGSLAVLAFLSRVLGLLRDRLLTTEFGVGGVLDSYFSAFRIPDLLYNFLILGTFSSAFIPLFSKLIHKKDSLKDAQALVDDILIILTTVMGLVSIFIVLGAPILVRIVAISYEGQKFTDTVTLTRIMAFSPLIFSVSSLVSSILNTYKKFFMVGLAPLFYNLGIIFGIIWLYPWFGVAGLGYGVILGAFLHLLIQLPSLLSVGFPFQFTWGFKWKNLHHLWKLYWPRLLVLDISTISIFIGTIVASTQSQAVSILSLASNLNFLPLGVLALSFVTAVFPYLSEAYAREDEDMFRHHFVKTLSQIILSLMPITVLMVLFRAQLVRIVYGAGDFDWEATIATYRTFTLFAVSIPFQGLIPLFARVLYARHDTKTPMIIGIGGMILNGILSYVLLQSHGVLGVAAAFSISMACICTIYAWVVFRRLNHGTVLGVFRYGGQVGLVASSMIAIVYILKEAWGWMLGDINTLVELVIQVGGVSVLALAWYGWVSYQLGLTRVIEKR